MKLLKWFVILLAVAFVGIQFVSVEKQNPPVDSSKTLYTTTSVPANVQSILERSCKDCHSNETHWPWYSHVAPVSWLVADDVHDGRHEMNFSEWADYAPKKKIHKLNNVCKLVNDGEMPISKYTLIHRKAVLTQADRDTLCAWVKSVTAPAEPVPSATPVAK